jgi:hypothetical protein
MSTVSQLAARRPSAAWLTLQADLRLKALVGGCIAALLALEAWAASTGYGLRVTSDTPTFLPIVRDLAVHPLQPVSPFLDDPHVATSHGSPYSQLLGLLWRLVAPSHDATGAPAADPRALYTFLAVMGIGVTLLVCHAVFVWARSQAGSRVAWLTLPVLLVLFGPANVIWAGDLTFHGFLYGAYFPQNVALAFLLYALTVLERPPSGRRTALASVCIAITVTVHPFTGVLLMTLVAVRGCSLAVRRHYDWVTGSVATLAGFGIGLLWPAYSLNDALVDAGVHGWLFVVACALAPLVARGFERPERALAVAGRIAASLDVAGRTRSRGRTGLAVTGLVVVVALAVWEALLVHAGSPDPLVRANRLAVYWGEDRWRWILMLAGGAVGCLGLVALARRALVVPIVWAAGCVGLGLVGAIGLSIPVWWRFLLFAQVPLALGTAQILGRLGRRTIAWGAVTATLVVLLAVKLTTLFVVPQQDTYFGTGLQEAYEFSDMIPAAPGLVATDPFTAYYVPGSTGHRVLSVTKAHVNSRRELADSERGYAVLHRLYTGNPADWWSAAQAMYLEGVRYVLIAKQTSLAPRTLTAFSTGPTPLVRTAADRRQLSRYFYRCNRVGTRIYDSDDYVVYRLDASRLWTVS